jgi:hypothetical protein
VERHGSETYFVVGEGLLGETLGGRERTLEAAVEASAPPFRSIALRTSSCDWDMTADGVWFNFRLVLVEGAVAALAAGLVVLGVCALRRRKPAPVSAPAP